MVRLVIRVPEPTKARLTVRAAFLDMSESALARMYLAAGENLWDQQFAAMDARQAPPVGGEPHAG
jgi:plasmid stability protein